MKKMIIFAAALCALAAPVQAGKHVCVTLPPRALSATSVALTIGEWSAYLVGGIYLSAQGAIAWPLGIPAMAVYLSTDQRTYNRANGISHSRDIRRAQRAAR